MRKAVVVIIYTLSLITGQCQQIQEIPNPPSKEIYDLLVDKKGLLWIAHDLGISRYDGISFTNFINAEQTAISMTDLVEDNYGRIWCHNFNGQIFYIQNEKMYCLKDYDFKKEAGFPRMLLDGDELLATSNMGLFVCNTATLKCRYVRPNENSTQFGFLSLCRIGANVLILAQDNIWYTYKKESGLHLINSEGFNFKKELIPLIKLEPRNFGDTAFLMDNAEGLLYGIGIVNNTVKPIFKKHVSSTINTLCIVDKQIWVNTNKESFCLSTGDTIKNYNITSTTKDKEGNNWYSSLTNGLLVSFQPSNWKNVQANLLGGNDYIRCLKKEKNWFTACSEYGRLFLLNHNDSNHLFKEIYIIPSQSGVPENIQFAYADKFFIENSKSIYLLSAATKSVRKIDSITSTKDITLHKNIAYLAGANQMTEKDIRDWSINNTEKPIVLSLKGDSLFLGYSKFWRLNDSKKKGRCRAVLFDSASSTLLAAFSDGLLRLKGNSITTVLYEGQPLYVSSMAKYGDRIYIGTFNNGLFGIENNIIKKITYDAESSSDAIVKLKCCNNYIWIFRAHGIEVLNARNNTLINNIYPLPVNSTDIADVEEDDKNIYISSHQGLYATNIFGNAGVKKVSLFLRYVQVNNADTIFGQNISLSSNKNNLLFRFQIPAYKSALQLHLKYRLLSSGSENTWYYTQEGLRDIQFNALRPGSYALEIIAVSNNLTVSRAPLIYHFTILQPWYNTIWFYCSLVLFSALVFWALYQYRLRQVFKIERIRRKISNDLHDDIGSTLSSINVYSQLAKSGSNNEYINTIQSSTVDIINNLDDLVWNINPKNDILQQLLNRMQLFGMPLLEEKGIECVFKIKVQAGDLLVSPDLRANLFLLFKEIINNVVKHSNASMCNINIIQKNKMFRLIISDNGKGFDTKNIKTHRNGLQSMAQRAKDMKGEITINSLPNAGTEIKLKCILK